MQILEQQHHRREPALPLDQSEQQIPGSRAHQRAVQFGQRIIGDFKTEQIEQQPAILRRPASQALQSLVDLAGDGGIGFAGAQREPLPHHLDKRQERGLLPSAEQLPRNTRIGSALCRSANS